MYWHRSLLVKARKSRQQVLSGGFSLLELTLVLVVLGLLFATAAPAWQAVVQQRQHETQGQRRLEQLSAALTNYAARHHRLPCPDMNGNGHEGMDGQCSDDQRVGWLPTATLGLSPVAAEDRVIYAVYRTPAVDLAAPAALLPESTGRDDFLTRLREAARSPSAPAPVVTGEGTRQGDIDCAGNPVQRPAYILLLTGEDRDGDGRRADLINPDQPRDPGCFAGPGHPVTTEYDDLSIAVSAQALYGQIVQL